jgi:hypothetical protein
MKIFANINQNEYEDLLSVTSYNDFFSMDRAMSHGSFSEIENRVIVNAIGQRDHAKGIQITPNQNSKIAALATIAKELNKNNGVAPQQSIDAFISAGYTSEGLAEVMGKVAIHNTSRMLFNDLEFDGGRTYAAA